MGYTVENDVITDQELNPGAFRLEASMLIPPIISRPCYFLVSLRLGKMLCSARISFLYVYWLNFLLLVYLRKFFFMFQVCWITKLNNLVP